MTDPEMMAYLEEALDLVADISAERHTTAHARVMKMTEAQMTGVLVVLATAVAESPEAGGKLLQLVAKKRQQMKGV